MKVSQTQAMEFIEKGIPSASLGGEFPKDPKLMQPVEVKEVLRTKGGLRYNVVVGRKPNPFSNRAKNKAVPRRPMTLRVDGFQ